eukprot:CAMPEP_0197468874 /NCGR_PEP_ID=MMETSP1175-20131217/66312_1 /TAXON_ID=1003142 /ORGANISM="Triceratium dubium, Strain CCMP147" /LENGTH=150 /DNA_ID=CAMNT_0043004999 /DNA_START=630 /DNA_END=1078 /DNA_ORIENTATION=-
MEFSVGTSGTKFSLDLPLSSPPGVILSLPQVPLRYSPAFEKRNLARAVERTGTPWIDTRLQVRTLPGVKAFASSTRNPSIVNRHPSLHFIFTDASDTGHQILKHMMRLRDRLMMQRDLSDSHCDRVLPTAAPSPCHPSRNVHPGYPPVLS